MPTSFPASCLFQLEFYSPCTCTLIFALLQVSARTPEMQHRLHVFHAPHVGSHHLYRGRDRSWLKVEMSWLPPGGFSGIPTPVPLVLTHVLRKGVRISTEALVPWAGIWCCEDTFNLSPHLICFWRAQYFSEGTVSALTRLNIALFVPCISWAWSRIIYWED